MAIFYDYIKGIDKSGTKTTYLHFRNSESLAPYFNFSSAEDENVGLGEILTARGANQTLYKNLIFNINKEILTLNGNYKISFPPDGLEFQAKTNANSWRSILKLIEGGTAVPKLSLYGHTIGNLEGDVGIQFPGGCAVEAIERITSQSYIESSVYVKAPYFNATSDRNAKENITTLKNPILPILKSVPVNSFNFKGKEEKMIGIIAQDMEEFDIEGISFVSNPENDYKMLRESKLIYLLGKGIQEQQEQIENLSSRLAALENK